MCLSMKLCVSQCVPEYVLEECVSDCVPEHMHDMFPSVPLSIYLRLCCLGVCLSKYSPQSVSAYTEESIYLCNCEY